MSGETFEDAQTMNTSIRDEQLALQKLILDAARDFEDKTGMTIYGEIRIFETITESRGRYSLKLQRTPTLTGESKDEV